MTSKTSFALWMGLRYLHRGKRGFSAFVNWVSVIGLALGVMLFIVISSIHNGLTELTQERLLKSIPHAFLPDEDKTADSLQQLASEDGVVEISDYFEGFVLLQADGNRDGVMLIGHEKQATEALRNHMVRGEPERINQGILISEPMAIDYDIGDPITIVFVAVRDGSFRPHIQRLELIGTFEFRSQADYSNAFVAISMLKEQGLLELGRYGKRIYLEDPMELSELESTYPDLQTWGETYEELFRAYQLEKVVLYVLMFLAVVLASFNIISGQAMLVSAKRGDIAIMSTMGAPPSHMLKVLAIQGLLVAFSGVLIGMCLGVLIAEYVDVLFDLFDDTLGITLLEGTAFSSLPTKIQPLDVTVGVIVALLLSAYAVVRPVWRLLQVNPTEELG